MRVLIIALLAAISYAQTDCNKVFCPYTRCSEGALAGKPWPVPEGECCGALHLCTEADPLDDSLDKEEDGEEAVGIFGWVSKKFGTAVSYVTSGWGRTITGGVASIAEAINGSPTINWITGGKKILMPDGSLNPSAIISIHSRATKMIIDYSRNSKVGKAFKKIGNFIKKGKKKLEQLKDILDAIDDIDLAEIKKYHAAVAPKLEKKWDEFKDYIEDKMEYLRTEFSENMKNAAQHEAVDILKDVLIGTKEWSDPGVQAAVEDWFDRNIYKKLESIRYRLGLVDGVKDLKEAEVGQSTGTSLKGHAFGKKGIHPFFKGKDTMDCGERGNESCGPILTFGFIIGAGVGAVFGAGVAGEFWIKIPTYGGDWKLKKDGIGIPVKMALAATVGLSVGVDAGGGAQFMLGFSWNTEPSGVAGIAFTLEGTAAYYGGVVASMDFCLTIPGVAGAEFDAEDDDPDTYRNGFSITLCNIKLGLMAGVKAGVSIGIGYTHVFLDNDSFKIKPLNWKQKKVIGIDVRTAVHVQDDWFKCAEDGQKCICKGDVRYGGFLEKRGNQDFYSWHVKKQAVDYEIDCNENEFAGKVDGVKGKHECHCLSDLGCEDHKGEFSVDETPADHCWGIAPSGTDIRSDQGDGYGGTSFEECKKKAKARGVRYFAHSPKYYNGFCKVQKKEVKKLDLTYDQGIGYKLYKDTCLSTPDKCWRVAPSGTDIRSDQGDGYGSTSLEECKKKAKSRGVKYFAWSPSFYHGFCKVQKKEVTNLDLTFDQGYDYELYKNTCMTCNDGIEKNAIAAYCDHAQWGSYYRAYCKAQCAKCPSSVTEIHFSYAGDGGCPGAPLVYFGKQDTLNKAKLAMLNHDSICSKDDSVLFHSKQYGYSWPAYCLGRESFTQCNDHNKYWQRYVLNRRECKDTDKSFKCGRKWMDCGYGLDCNHPTHGHCIKRHCQGQCNSCECWDTAKYGTDISPEENDVFDKLSLSECKKKADEAGVEYVAYHPNLYGGMCKVQKKYTLPTGINLKYDQGYNYKLYRNQCMSYKQYCNKCHNGQCVADDKGKCILYRHDFSATPYYYYECKLPKGQKCAKEDCKLGEWYSCCFKRNGNPYYKQQIIPTKEESDKEAKDKDKLKILYDRHMKATCYDRINGDDEQLMNLVDDLGITGVTGVETETAISEANKDVAKSEESEKPLGTTRNVSDPKKQFAARPEFFFGVCLLFVAMLLHLRSFDKESTVRTPLLEKDIA